MELLISKWTSKMYLYDSKPVFLILIVGEQLHPGILVTWHISTWAMQARLNLGLAQVLAQCPVSLPGTWQSKQVLCRVSAQLFPLSPPRHHLNFLLHFSPHPQIHLQAIKMLRCSMEGPPCLSSGSSNSVLSCGTRDQGQNETKTRDVTKVQNLSRHSFWRSYKCSSCFCRIPRARASSNFMP